MWLHTIDIFFFLILLFTYIYRVGTTCTSTSHSLRSFISPLFVVRLNVECVNEEQKNELKPKNNVLYYVKQILNVVTNVMHRYRWTQDKTHHSSISIIIHKHSTGRNGEKYRKSSKGPTLFDGSEKNTSRTNELCFCCCWLSV